MHVLVMHQYFRCCMPLPVRAINRRYIGTLRGVKSMLDYLNNVGQCVNTAIYGPTADEVIKSEYVKGKTCLITGANCGIGLEMTRCLTAHDCTVLMACRNTYAASVVAKSICGNNHRLRFYEINLASLRSVKRCSDDILKDFKKIDIVLLNAGTFGLPWTLTEDNLETTFQVNYLSQYYLLTNIEKILAPNARIVFVSSESHRKVPKHASEPTKNRRSTQSYNAQQTASTYCNRQSLQREISNGASVTN
ncbi:WW domain-containing oxidoreductase isoform X3 [Manduca sexta]|uniref:WW domain-containing oxidoreductase isoform X3 n=1 Tax=Manduca sexta TaxID=7130 RepID=UPI00188ECC66|nr:WW domain-containing oxidoreductase isoform X3 [Manduca sexta]